MAMDQLKKKRVVQICQPYGLVGKMVAKKEKTKKRKATDVS